MMGLGKFVDQCIQVLKIDIDLPYSWVKQYEFLWVAHARFVLQMFRYYDIAVKFKKSPSGNTHVLIILDRCVDAKDYHVMMWLLGDDHKRLQHSIRRYLTTNKILDIHFRQKRQDMKQKNKKEDT